MPRKILIVRFSFISFQFSELEMATSSKENAEIKKIKKIKQVCSLQRSSNNLSEVDFSTPNFEVSFLSLGVFTPYNPSDISNINTTKQQSKSPTI